MTECVLSMATVQPPNRRTPIRRETTESFVLPIVVLAWENDADSNNKAPWRAQLCIGQALMVLNSDSEWGLADVVELTLLEVFVQFHGESAFPYEWLPRASMRLAPPYWVPSKEEKDDDEEATATVAATRRLYHHDYLAWRTMALRPGANVEVRSDAAQS